MHKNAPQNVAASDESKLVAAANPPDILVAISSQLISQRYDKVDVPIYNRKYQKANIL
jgi:hypothetical protein